MDESAGRSRPIRVVIVDDHRVVQSGIMAYLDQIQDIEVVAVAADGREAVDRMTALEVAGDLPDVVLMDMVMPVLVGVAATRELRARWPNSEVVAMTSFVLEAIVHEALEAGAAGYLLKDADADHLATAIRSAVAGVDRRPWVLT